ncbi:MAG: CRISPR-associated endoribonuclease Cas6 [Bacillales bacterium]|nr:CRISPR-associated endoribonuclease Cas6 [Bacillales bacterium]
MTLDYFYSIVYVNFNVYKRFNKAGIRLILSVILESKKPYIDLPTHYPYLIQSFLYKNIDDDLSYFMHEEGFKIDDKTFKLFVFSRLIGESKFIKETKTFRFYGPFQLLVSSAYQPFIRNMFNLILKENLYLGDEHLKIKSIENIPSLDNTNTNVRVASYSPVVSYSTVHTQDGKKKRIYYKPDDPNYTQFLTLNLIKKAKFLYGADTVFEPIKIKPVGRFKHDIVYGKNTVINGYTGNFILEGDPRLIKTAIETGLGSKNSLGFGFVYPKEKRLPLIKEWMAMR